MAVFTIRVRGVREVQQRLNGLAARNPRAAQSSVRTEAEIELTEMKKLTPVDLGNLRITGRVEELLGQIGIRWAFGGTTGKFAIKKGPRKGQIPFVDYAVKVHQDLGVFHTTGQAKFIEIPLMESLPFLAERIGRRWAREMGLA